MRPTEITVSEAVSLIRKSEKSVKSVKGTFVANLHIRGVIYRVVSEHAEHAEHAEPKQIAESSESVEA